MKQVSNPKTLAALQYEDYVLRTNSNNIQGKAESYFKDIMNDERHVYCRHIFTEQDEQFFYKVYECYTDSGSVDYLYIIHF